MKEQKVKCDLKRILSIAAVVLAVVIGIGIGLILSGSNNDSKQDQVDNNDKSTAQDAEENTPSPEPASQATEESTPNSESSNEMQNIQAVDYATADLTQYYGDYYSPTGDYGITLSESTKENTISIKILRSTGEILSGNVEPGSDCILQSNGEIWGGIYIGFLKDGTVHVSLTPRADPESGYEEDLIPGNYSEIFGVTSAKMLAYLDDEAFFAALAQIERNCMQMDASMVINNPQLYCDGNIYRFPGVVTYVNGSVFILEIADVGAMGLSPSNKLVQISENNQIICHTTDYSVFVGEKVCVYGEGIGRESYTRTNHYGIAVPYETLAVDVGYIMRDGGIECGKTLTDYMENYVYGTYELKESSSNPYVLERTIYFGPNSINDRPYHIKRVLLDFVYGNITTVMSGAVILQVETTASVRRGQERNVTFFIDLDGSGLGYSSAWETGTNLPGYDTASYIRVSSAYASPDSEQDEPAYDESQQTGDPSYDLDLWQGRYFSNKNECLIELGVLPTGTDYFMNAYWDDGREDWGMVTPGVLSTLDGGTEVMLNLETDGSITLDLDGMGAEALCPVAG